jgi:hypothetical protein
VRDGRCSNAYAGRRLPKCRRMASGGAFPKEALDVGADEG